jgi:hypothetical protein
MEELVIEEDGPSSALHISLGDFLAFIKWMDQSRKSLDGGYGLPNFPEGSSGKVHSWVQILQRLNERVRRSEEKIQVLEKNVIAYEAEIDQILSKLHANIALFYDHLGQSHKAEEVRRRAETLRC